MFLLVWDMIGCGNSYLESTMQTKLRFVRIAAFDRPLRFSFLTSCLATRHHLIRLRRHRTYAKRPGRSLLCTALCSAGSQLGDARVVAPCMVGHGRDGMGVGSAERPEDIILRAPG